MRDYQATTNRWVLPEDVYRQTLWFIRGYYRRQEEAENIIDASPSPADGLPHGSGTSDPVSQKVAQRVALTRSNDLIDEQRAKIPAEYRDAVWQNIQFRTRYPDYADRHTYGRWKSKLVYMVAVAAGFYEGGQTCAPGAKKMW